MWYLEVRLVLIIIFAKIFIVPIRHILKLVINSIFGGALIWIINTIFASTGFHIGLNFFTAIFIGILGIPGAITLIAIKLLI